jgi:hypothetical protein
VKLQLLLAARGGRDSDLRTAVEGEAQRALGQLRGPGSAEALVRLANDPFAPAQPRMRPFEAVLELGREGGDAAGTLLAAAAGAGERLDDLIHADLSAALLGPLHVIVTAPPCPVRYLYAMRRKAGMDRQAYLAHYFGHHAQFGRRTPGIAGYDQFHPDPALSRAAAGAAGLGVWAVDSVAELHLRSAQEFFDAAVRSKVGQEAIADEEGFVDRANSVAFCSEVTLRLRG